MLTLDHEVEAFAVDRDLGDAQAVVEGVDGVAEFPGRHAVVGEARRIGINAHFRRPQLQPRLGPELVALACRQALLDDGRALERHAEHNLEVGPRNIEVDGSPAADMAPEQGRLGNEAEGSRLAEGRLGECGNQFAGSPRIIGDGADKGSAAARHEEEVLDLRRPALDVGAALRHPQGAHRVLHALGDVRRRLQVVARWRQQDAENQVAVALGQVFELGQEQVGGGRAQAANDGDHGDGQRLVSHHGAGKGDDGLGKAARQGVEPGNAARRDGGRRLAQKPVGKRRDQGNGDDQRQHDGDRDGDRDVAEQLSDLQFHDQDGSEDQDRGHGRHKDGAPHLLGALVRRFARRASLLAQPVDVFEHDDGGVHHHAHGEGDAGQGDHVDRPSHGRHGDKGADHGNRNGQRYDEGGGARAQEDQQNDRGKGAADVNILLHQVDCRVDVYGLGVDLFEGQARPRQHRLVELDHRLLEPFHDLDDVGAGLAYRVEGHGDVAEVANGRRRVLESELDVGDVADGDPGDASRRGILGGAQQYRLDLVDGLELALGAHDVAALSFFHVTGRHRGVGAAQGAYHLRNRQPVARHARRIDDDLHLALAAPVDVAPRHAGDALQAVLDDVFDEVAVGVYRPVVAGRALEDEPGDGAVLAARRIQGGLFRLVGISAHPVEPVGDEQQRPVHVLIDGELEGDGGAPVLGAARHLVEALEATQHFLLAVDEFAFDLGGRGAGPGGAHRDDRLAGVGGELNGDELEGEQAEHEDHDHRRDDGDRALDGEADQVHD